jgi:hypothetical protein
VPRMPEARTRGLGKWIPQKDTVRSVILV